MSRTGPALRAAFPLRAGLEGLSKACQLGARPGEHHAKLSSLRSLSLRH